MKAKLEQVKEDLSRYAVAYEAGRAESMNKDQKDKLEEKVRVMKELQTELEHDEKETGYPEDEADESDVRGLELEVVNEKLLLISSAANIIRKEI